MDIAQVAMESSPPSKMLGAIGVMSKEPGLVFGRQQAPVMPWLMPSSGLSLVARVMVLRIVARLGMMLTADIRMRFNLRLKLGHGSR
jgi:hypothetical protein